MVHLVVTSAGEPPPVSIPLLVIAGPTGVGKSAIAVAVARAVGGEVVGADSMQVYRGMDIGTGKLRVDEMGGVEHHMIDVWDAMERGSAGRYLREARAAVAAIHGRGHLPILCGGTGLYIRSVLDGLAEGTARDPEIEQRLEERLGAEGAAALHRELAEIDPLAAERIAPGDGFRIIRALGVYFTTGMPFSRVQEEATTAGGYDVVYVVLNRPRAALYRRIDRRVAEMFAAGFVDEVRRLAPRLGPTARAAIGYRECLQHLAGEIDLAATAVAVQAATRRYAKRQLTWFRAVPDAIELDVEGQDVAVVARWIVDLLADRGIWPPA
jgi:tRNA dimethylallyltransferase